MHKDLVLNLKFVMNDLIRVLTTINYKSHLGGNLGFQILLVGKRVTKSILDKLNK